MSDAQPTAPAVDPLTAEAPLEFHLGEPITDKHTMVAEGGEPKPRQDNGDLR